MGNTNSVTGSVQDSVQHHSPSPVEILDLILATLPIVCDLCRSLSKTINKRDKRYGYLGNIQSSTATLQQHLEGLKREGNTNIFGSQIEDLADHLECIFSPELINFKVRSWFSFALQYLSVIELGTADEEHDTGKSSRCTCCSR